MTKQELDEKLFKHTLLIKPEVYALFTPEEIERAKDLKFTRIDDKNLEVDLIY